MNDPERLDLESASSAYRRRRCPGSPNLVRALRAAGKLSVRLPDPDAASGTLVHLAWCGARDVVLNAHEADTLESFKRMESLVVTDWARGEEIVLLGREQRLWLHQGFDPIHSGAFDVAYGTVGESARMLIIDGKSGWGEVTPAEGNDQLREMVALARANFPRCEEFSVAVLQPKLSLKPSVAVYDQTEAELALRQLRATIRDCADPAAPRIAGPWCNYCPAFGLCDEAKAVSVRTVSLAQQIAEGEFALPLGADAARLLDGARLARDLLEAMLARYKEILANDPEAVPGWYLKPGRVVRKIPDPLAAQKIAETFMSASDFYRALNVSVTTLVEVCKKTSGLRGKALEDYFNERFAAVINLSVDAPTLAKRAPGALKNGD